MSASPAVVPDRMRIFRPPVSAGGITVYRIGYSRSGSGVVSRIGWRSACYGLVLPTVRAGSIRVANAHECRLDPDCGLLLFPGQEHAYGPLRHGSPWPHAAVLCDGPAVQALQSSGRITARRPVLRFADPAAVHRLYRRLVRAQEAALPPLVYQLLYEAGGGEPLLEIGGWRPHPVDALIARVSADPLADWDLPAEARALGIGPAHCRRLFRERCGDPPLRFLARARMRLAGRLLLEGTSSVQAASRIGMDDPAHFSKRFRSLMGASPRQWLAQQTG